MTGKRNSQYVCSIINVLLFAGLLVFSTRASACEVILYRDIEMEGPVRHLSGSAPDLRYLGFNDETSSLVVISGTWDLYIDVGYRRLAVTVGPGEYPDVRAIGMPNDSLSSLGCRW